MYLSVLLLHLNSENLNKQPIVAEMLYSRTPQITHPQTPHHLSREEVIKSILTNNQRNVEQSCVFISLFTAIEQLSNSRVTLVNRFGLGDYSARYFPYINVCYFYVRRVYRRVAKKFTLYTFLYLLTTALITKDLSLLKHFFEEKFKNLKFKKHRRILSMLRYIFRLILRRLVKQEIVKGFRLELTGKIGAAGSVKKKKWTFKYGCIKLSSKHNFLKYEVGSLWTRTGCLGLRLYLAY